MAKVQMQGQRLPYAVIPLEGEVTTIHHEFNRRTGKVEAVEAKEPAGWLIGYPDGHYLRIRRAEDMRRYGINKKPKPIGGDGMNLHPSEKPEQAFGNLEADIWSAVQKINGAVTIPGYDRKIVLPQKQLEEDYA